MVDTAKRDHVTWSAILNLTSNPEFQSNVRTNGLHFEIFGDDGTTSIDSLDFSPTDCSKSKSRTSRFSCTNKQNGASIVFKKYNGRVNALSSPDHKTSTKSSSLYTVTLKWTKRGLTLPPASETPLVIDLSTPGGVTYQSSSPDCWTKETSFSEALLCYPSYHKLAAENHVN